MGLQTISPGQNPPNDINVHIEIPKGSNVKFELDDSGILHVDRIVHTPMMYPLDYGYIPGTLSEDGDPLDVMVLMPNAVPAGCVIRCRPVGALLMEDEAGMDEKIIAVPVSKVTPMYNDIHTLEDLPDHLMERVRYFFEHYKDLEDGKFVKLKETADEEVAKKLILEAIERASTTSSPE